MKSVYTTGEVAHICKVSQQTIIRCFDSGRLKGFKVPGSKFRRIPRESLIQFMRDNDIPLAQLESAKKKILVVDDDEAIVEMFVELLARDSRFEIRTAGSGYEAGMLTQEFRPELILLDFGLPDINGNVVCRLIRSNPALEHIKIIVISGLIDSEEIDALLRAGADEFIKKPFAIDQVINKIAEHLDLRPPAMPESA